MNLSLILATVDRAQEVERLLESLITQTNRDFELIVVDQNGDDRLVPILQRAVEVGLDVQHIRFNIRSLSAARNHGLTHAKYAIVAFPDDDCWYDHRVVERIIHNFSGDPALDGIEACWVESRPTCRGAYQLSFAGWQRFRGIAASSITLFFKTALLKQLEGFDARLGVPGWFGSGEETDLVMRCLATGAVVRFAPDVLVHHAFEAGFQRQTLAQCGRARKRARGTGAILIKHRLSPLVVIRAVFSPFVKALTRPWRVGYVVRNACVTFGIVEGMVGWVRQAQGHTSKALSSEQKN